METFEQHPQQWTGIPERPGRPSIGWLLLATILGAVIGGAVVFFAVDDSSDDTTETVSPTSETTTTTTTSLPPGTTVSLPPTDSIAGLANRATYPVEGSATGFVTLLDGSAQESIPDSGETLTVGVVETVEIDIDRDGTTDAVVILAVNSGGTGQFHYAYGLFGDDPQPVVTNAIPLGDRITVDEIAVNPLDSTVGIRYRDHSELAAFSDPPDTLVIADLLILRSGAETTSRGSISLADADDPQVSEASTITTGGLGPIRIGMTIEEATKAAGAALIAPTESSPTPSEGCGFARLDGLDGVGFMILDGVIGRVDIESGPIATVSGARIGSTEQEIQDLFPDLIVVTPHQYVDGHYLTLVPAAEDLAEFRVVFETDGQVVTSYRAGHAPEVEFVEGCA